MLGTKAGWNSTGFCFHSTPPRVPFTSLQTISIRYHMNAKAFWDFLAPFLNRSGLVWTGVSEDKRVRRATFYYLAEIQFNYRRRGRANIFMQISYYFEFCDETRKFKHDNNNHLKIELINSANVLKLFHWFDGVEIFWPCMFDCTILWSMCQSCQKKSLFVSLKTVRETLRKGICSILSFKCI